jgi:hypothetical protein
MIVNSWKSDNSSGEIYSTQFPISLSLKADGSATYKSNGHYFNGNFNGIWSYSDNSVTFNFRDQEYIFKSRGRALYDTTNREILKPLSQSPPPSGDGTIELEGGGNFSRYAFIHAIAGV